MATKKKSTTPRTNRSHWLEKLVIVLAVIAFVWTLLASFVPGGKLVPIFWVSALVIGAKIVVTGVFGKNFTYFVKLMLKKCREALEDSDEDEEDDEDDEDPDEDDVGPGVKPLPAFLKDPKNNVWTVVTVWYNGKEVSAWSEMPKKDPTKAPKGYKYDPETNTYVELPKPDPKPVVGDKKAMIKRLMAAGYSLEEALDEVEGK